MQSMVRTLRLFLAALMLALMFGLACGAGHAETTGAPGAVVDFRTQFKNSLTDVPDQNALTIKGRIYVPAYSRVYGAGAGERKQIELSTTLRIDNTSGTKPLVIENIEYFDTGGKLVQRFIVEPVAVRPFGSVEIVVPADDDRAGVAGNFIVDWAGNGPIAEPLVEAVMIGSQDNTSYSFVSPGRPIRHVGRSAWPSFRFRF
jgi:hypothetical protein